MRGRTLERRQGHTILTERNYRTSLCWLRRDLRLIDHHALARACATSDQVLVAFISAPDDFAPVQNEFVLAALAALDAQLRRHGSALLHLTGKPEAELLKVLKQHQIEAVFCNWECEPAAKQRDVAVARKLAKAGVEFHRLKDHVIFAGDEILKADGTPYRVFTPYKKAWLARLTSACVSEQRPDLNKLFKFTAKAVSLDLPPLAKAKDLLKTFTRKIGRYAEARDFPAVDGTSKLSVHLRFGTISIRTCVRACVEEQNPGAQTWLTELIWREFYHMILDRFPEVETMAFQAKYRQLQWPGSARHFKVWCAGATGYPLIDAAMRQLNQTGWMHNRLRMVTASFLVKDLLVDWRLGESYFASKLIDFDLAANNGGWQWCASTGCDAQPYFRTFNPTVQSERFDRNGDFLRRYLPELHSLSDRAIHAPHAAKTLPVGFRLGRDYPKPIVDRRAQRVKALKLFRT